MLKQKVQLAKSIATIVMGLKKKVRLSKNKEPCRRRRPSKS